MTTFFLRKTRQVALLLAVMLVLFATLLFTLALYAAPPRQTPAAAMQTGNITGRVTGSDGGNVGPIMVRILGYTLFVSGETRVDANGYYTFSGLAPITYTIVFNPLEEGPYLWEYFDNTHSYSNQTAVSVNANATTSGIDAELQRGGTITGFVTAAGSGAPLAGIRVDVYPRTNELASSRATNTDAAGHYQIEGLFSDYYEICFNAYRENDDQYLYECYDNTTDYGDRQEVTVTEGVVTPNINAELTLGGMIQGRVTSELNGAPLANVRVLADGEYGGSRETATDAAGYYTITGLYTGSHRVDFNPWSEDQGHGQEWYNNQDSYETADLISITHGMTATGIDAALPFILNITGRVENAITREPVTSIYVYAVDATGEARQYAYVDSSGLYTITGLAPGPYRIRFGNDQYANQYYGNSTIFEEATWVTVTKHVVIPNINAALIPRTGSEIALATAATRPNALAATRKGGYIAHYNPIYTLDGGLTWQTFVTLPLVNLWQPAVVALMPKDDPEQPVRVLYGADVDADPISHAIYRSADGGATWSNFPIGTDFRCDPGSADGVYEFAASPADPYRAFALTACYRTEYAFEGSYRIYYWAFRMGSDGGVNWHYRPLPGGYEGEIRVDFQEHQILPSPVAPPLVYLRTHGFDGITHWHRSETSGESWITEAFTLTTLTLDWTSAAKLYGVLDRGNQYGEGNVFRYTGKRSDNTGVTWSDWPQQPCRTSFQQLLALPTANTLLLLCDQGLYRSGNGGDSWQLLTTQSGGRLWTHAGDHELVMWVRGAEIWGSRDQGETWSDLGGWSELNLPVLYGE